MNFGCGEIAGEALAPAEAPSQRGIKRIVEVPWGEGNSGVVAHVNIRLDYGFLQLNRNEVVTEVFFKPSEHGPPHFVRGDNVIFDGLRSPSEGYHRQEVVGSLQLVEYIGSQPILMITNDSVPDKQNIEHPLRKKLRCDPLSAHKINPDGTEGNLYHPQSQRRISPSWSRGNMINDSEWQMSNCEWDDEDFDHRQEGLQNNVNDHVDGAARLMDEQRIEEPVVEDGRYVDHMGDTTIFCENVVGLSYFHQKYQLEKEIHTLEGELLWQNGNEGNAHERLYARHPFDRELDDDECQSCIDSLQQKIGCLKESIKQSQAANIIGSWYRWYRWMKDRDAAATIIVRYFRKMKEKQRQKDEREFKAWCQHSSDDFLWSDDE